MMMKPLILVTLILFATTTPCEGKRSKQQNKADQRIIGFVHEPASTFVTLDGKKATIKCQAAPPGCTLFWLSNGNPFDADSFGPLLRLQKQKRNEHLSVRLPKNVTSYANAPDEVRRFLRELSKARFQCGVRLNDQVLLSQPAQFIVPSLDTFEREEDISVTVYEGNIAVIPCKPPPSVPMVVTEFLFNGTLIDRSRGRYYLMPSGNLQIHDVRQSDGGVYQCVANNPFLNQKTSSTRHVTVKVKRAPGNRNSPRAQNGPLQWAVEPGSTTTPVKGTNVTLECVANSVYPPNVTWARTSGDINKYRTVQVGGSLVIVGVVPEDDGTYTCTATSHDGRQIAARTMLSIQTPPAFARLASTDVPLHDGKKLAIDCFARGNPPPIVTWYLNGRELSAERLESLQIDLETERHSGGRLVIGLPKRGVHEGIYQCLAENSLGSAMVFSTVAWENDSTGSHDIEHDDSSPKEAQCQRDEGSWSDLERRECPAEVSGRRSAYVKPGKPEITRLSHDSVLVKWDIEKVSDGSNLGILFFKIQYKIWNKTGEHNWQTLSDDLFPATRSYAVPELKTETRYRFRIAVVYTNAAQATSELSEIFVLKKIKEGSTKPATHPKITAVLAISPSALNVQWTYGTKDEPNTKGFYIFYRLVSSAGKFMKDVVVGSQTRSHILSHLLPDQAYELKIQSFNDYGSSDFTPMYSNKTWKPLPMVPATSTPASGPDVDDDNDHDDHSMFGHDQTLYLVVAVASGSLVLVVIVCLVICLYRRKPGSKGNSVPKRRQKPRDRHAKANSVHNITHGGFLHDYGNPYGNYHKGSVNGITTGTMGLKSSLSNGFVFKDTNEEKQENIHIRCNPLSEEVSYEGRSRTLTSSTTFIGSRSLSTRDIMRNSSASQHSLHHNNQVSANNATNMLSSNQQNHSQNNNISEPEQSNGFILSSTVERGRRGRASGHFIHDEQHPSAFVRMNHRSSSFTRLNGTLERRRKSRTDLLAAVDHSTLSRGECEPMLNNRCNGTLNNGSAANGHVIMQSSC
ncbi:Interference hedgehog [Halotydeus destructor]|nr:Interference hedgehog [Halotydeus destructor]